MLLFLKFISASSRTPKTRESSSHCQVPDVVTTVRRHQPEATQVITLEEYMASGAVVLLDKAIKTVTVSLTKIQVGFVL